jgi:hypothetical protein
MPHAECVQRIWQPGSFRAHSFHDLGNDAVSRRIEGGMNPLEMAAIYSHHALTMLSPDIKANTEELARKLG